MEFTLLVGRILFGGFFLLSAFNHFTKTQAYTAYTQSKSVPMPKLAVLGTGILLLAGGLSVVFNIEPTLGLFALLIFLLPTTLMMHAFWKEKDPASKASDQANFFKNLALIGAILIMLS